MPAIPSVNVTHDIILILILKDTVVHIIIYTPYIVQIIRYTVKLNLYNNQVNWIPNNKQTKVTHCHDSTAIQCFTSITSVKVFF